MLHRSLNGIEIYLDYLMGERIQHFVVFEGKNDHAHTHIHKYTHMDPHTHAHTWTHIHMHTYNHTLIYSLTHTVT